MKITRQQLRKIIREEFMDDDHDPYAYIAELATNIDSLIPELDIALERLQNTTASDMEGLGGLDETNELQVQLENIISAIQVLSAQGWTAG